STLPTFFPSGPKTSAPMRSLASSVVGACSGITVCAEPVVPAAGAVVASGVAGCVPGWAAGGGGAVAGWFVVLCAHAGVASARRIADVNSQCFVMFASLGRTARRSIQHDEDYGRSLHRKERKDIA